MLISEVLEAVSGCWETLSAGILYIESIEMPPTKVLVLFLVGKTFLKGSTRRSVVS